MAPFYREVRSREADIRNELGPVSIQQCFDIKRRMQRHTDTNSPTQANLAPYPDISRVTPKRYDNTRLFDEREQDAE
ncbi:MAG TPA: hypothetical protein VIQ05_19850 [Tardiphaga sp.]